MTFYKKYEIIITWFNRYIDTNESYTVQSIYTPTDKDLSKIIRDTIVDLEMVSDIQVEIKKVLLVEIEKDDI